jgi:hypothetical protein
MRGPVLVSLVAAAGLTLSVAPEARAQAWTPPKGEASLSIGLGSAWANEHTDDQGNALTIPGTTEGWGSMWWEDGDTELGYGITDRLALRVALPLVVGRYEGDFPHPLLPGHQNVDDGSWHSSFGDFRAEVRFRATKGSLVVTPFAAFATPSHSYEFIGHATAGLGLSEGQVGVNFGRLLDPLVPNAYAQVRYTFAMNSKVLGISHYRSNLYLDAGYFVTSALTVSVLGDLQVSHAGWRVADVPPPTDPNFVYHDQLQRANHLQLGGTVSYALTGSVEISLSGYGTVYSRREMNPAGVTLSLTYNFSPSQLIKRRKGPKDPQPSS